MAIELISIIIFGSYVRYKRLRKAQIIGLPTRTVSIPVAYKKVAQLFKEILIISFLYAIVFSEYR